MELVIFDLDGTLIDSAGDIARSVNDLRESLALRALPTVEIASYIGDGVEKLLERALPEATRAELAHATSLYRPIYRRRLLETTRPYPGVSEGLQSLYRAGCTLAVLTNKPERESLMILDGLALGPFFFAVYGGDSFERKKPDPIGVHHLLERTGIDPDAALFVGDSPVDQQTAHRAAVRFCLVSYGIASLDLAPTSRDLRIDDLRELTSLLPS